MRLIKLLKQLIYYIKSLIIKLLKLCTLVLSSRPVLQHLNVNHSVSTFPHDLQAKPIYGGWLCLAPEGTDFDNPMQRSRVGHGETEWKFTHIIPVLYCDFFP